MKRLFLGFTALINFFIGGADQSLSSEEPTQASITTDPALRESFAMDGKLPATVIRIAIDTVYFQCARALLRSSLWKPEAWPKARTAPTSGEMLRDADQHLTVPPMMPV